MYLKKEKTDSLKQHTFSLDSVNLWVDKTLRAVLHTRPLNILEIPLTCIQQLPRAVLRGWGEGGWQGNDNKKIKET